MGTLTFIIILGIISSIIGKVKANNPKNQNKPFSVSNLDDIKELFKGKLEQNQVKRHVVKPPESTKGNFRGKYQKVKQETLVNQPIEQLEDVIKVEQVISPLSDVKKETHVTHRAASEADQIINGIIWSEILGAPRAKKSYFSSKR
jgi:hypothetical protein